MAETKGTPIPRNCTKLIYVFRPIFNVSSPSWIEWTIHYMLDWGIDINAYDMAKIRYKLYNNDTSSWANLNAEGHMFYNNHDNSSANYDQYIGHQCNQVYNVRVAYNNKYLDKGGLVRVAICFDVSVVAGESELQEVASPSKTAKRSEMTVYFNSMEIY